MIYNFTIECDSCGATPTIAGLELCAVCTTGESAMLWDWTNHVKRNQLKHAIKLVDEALMTEGLVIKATRKGLKVDPIMSMLMKLEPWVWSNFESIIKRAEPND